MAPLYERRVGPRKVALEPGLAPWSRVEAVQPGQHMQGAGEGPVYPQQGRDGSAAGKG